MEIDRCVAGLKANMEKIWKRDKVEWKMHVLFPIAKGGEGQMLHDRVCREARENYIKLCPSNRSVNGRVCITFVRISFSCPVTNLCYSSCALTFAEVTRDAAVLEILQ